MRSTAALPAAAAAVLASLAAPAAALFDREACGGIGACTQEATCNYDSVSVQPEDAEWDCGSAGTITGQRSAGATLNFWTGLSRGEVVASADFPRCDLAQPSGTATLLKSNYLEGIIVYGWIDYQCAETEMFSNCYSSIKNPSPAYTCKIFKNGQACKNIKNQIQVPGSCPE